MGIRYVHTNIIAKDWRKLAAFYQDVFGCAPVPPERDLFGGWVDDLTGICGVHIAGAHLKLPGSDATLEIFSYDPAGLDSWRPINRPGLGHIAFHVDDVEQVLASVTAHGGQQVGEVVRCAVAGMGALTVVYACDPEGNGLELQHWNE
jgi:predicted enzyme related to lactoylglutathione lyase